MSTGDLTFSAIRANWPILLAFVAGIVAWTETRTALTSLQHTVGIHDTLLDREAFKEFAVWQTNVNRDIQELRAACRK